MILLLLLYAMPIAMTNVAIFSFPSCLAGVHPGKSLQFALCLFAFNSSILVEKCNATLLITCNAVLQIKIVHDINLADEDLV